MLQLIQVAGALAILAGFALGQFGVLTPQSSSYLALNLVGAAVLAVLAYRTLEPCTRWARRPG